MSVGVGIVLALLIAANALYVAAEFAVVSVRRSRVRRLAEDGSWLASQLVPYVEDPASLDRYVGVSQIGITLSSLVLGAYAQATISRPVAGILEPLTGLTPVAALSAAAALVLVALTVAQLVVGELVPKALALQYPTGTALATVLPMRWSLVVFRPFIAILNGTALRLLRVFGASAHGHQHLHSPEEIDLLIAESRDGGFLEPEEQLRLRRALHLGKRSAHDLMVPLERVTLVDLDAPWPEVLQTVLASPFSRLPVFRGSPNSVVGTLRVKDLVDCHAAGGRLSVDALMRPVVVLDAQLPADRVLATLRDRRAHSAMVVDGAGRTLGLITIQDVLAELLGSTGAHTMRSAAAADGGR